MPKGYAVPYDDPGSVGEQLLGRGDAKRTTKTFIEDGPLAMFLGTFRALPESIINAARRLHAEENGLRFKDVSAGFILEEYPEAREYIELHQQIIEHKGSQSGFLVEKYVNKASADEMDSKKEKQESSGDVKGSKWS